MAKVVFSKDAYDSNFKNHTINLCKDFKCYYITIDNMRLDWSFPLDYYDDAMKCYDELCEDSTKVSDTINLILNEY